MSRFGVLWTFWLCAWIYLNLYYRTMHHLSGLCIFVGIPGTHIQNSSTRHIVLLSLAWSWRVYLTVVILIPLRYFRNKRILSNRHHSLRSSGFDNHLLWSGYHPRFWPHRPVRICKGYHDWYASNLVQLPRDAVRSRFLVQPSTSQKKKFFTEKEYIWNE